MSRIFPSLCAGVAATILLAGSVGAVTFELDGKTYNTGKIISEAESDGSLSKEEANQFRDDEKKLAAEEETLKAKRNGHLSNADAKDLTKKLDALVSRIDKVRFAKADNTAKNLGDQRKSSLTPDKQSESKKDIKMLGAVRRRLMKDRALSSNAKNVKVICIKGEVTLRGPVDSPAEKDRVAALAAEAAGDAKVLNELEVVTK